jgi:serine/threonine-protein kinase
MADSVPAYAADRNLLFGILAFQMDFISREQLVATMHAWILDKTKPLGQILCAQGALPQAECDLLDALVQKHLEKHGGDVQKSMAALSSLPPVPDELAKLPDADVQAGMTIWSHKPVVATETADPQPTNASEHAGRFRILRPHARGGLGEVFVAEDQELHREVALKEIQSRHAEQPESRSRFLLEAEITGGLEHPGIVPVYSLGQYRNGRPFYAMRFIRGDSLAEAIGQFHRDGPQAQTVPSPGYDSLSFRQLLRRFVDVCNAIAYAHSRGVLHRDLKPGNIMLGKYGETLVVDWGLAKPLGRSPNDELLDEAILLPASGSEATPTQMGSAIGTPAYMSPEQAAGRLDELGPASDVYGLGATLYHVLTGRPAFSGKDVRAILHNVQKGDFHSPRSLRPEVPRPLEAVCLKAMAVEPADRYASARELADDVEHWLADEPVSAHRDPALVKAGRWARRHRTEVAAAATLLLAALTASTLGIVLLGRKNIEIEKRRQEAVTAQLDEAAQRDKAEKERDRAETNFELARDAVEKTLTSVAMNARLKESDFHDLRKELLGSAVPFYVEFVKQKRDDPTLESDRGKAYHRLAEVHSEMGLQTEAEADYQEMQKIFAKLVGEFPTEPEYRDELAASQNNLGILYRTNGKLENAEPLYREALALRQSLVKEFPKVREYRQALAATHLNMGNLFQLTSRFKEAEQAYRNALADMQPLAAEFSKAPEYRQELATIYTNLATLLRENNRSEEADRVDRDALAIKRPLAEDFPKVPRYRQDLGLSLYNLANTLSKTGTPKEAEQAYRDSLAILQLLAKDFPSVPAYRQDLARCCYNLGSLFQVTGQPKEAVAVYRQALDVWQSLAADFPKVPDHRQWQARSSNSLGIVLSGAGQPKESEQAFRDALAIQRKLVAEHPKVAAYREELARTYSNLAFQLSSDGRPREVEQAYRDALAIQQKLAGDFPKVPAFRLAQAKSQNNIGYLLKGSGRAKEAEQAYRDALVTFQSLAADFPKAPVNRQELIKSHTNLGDILRDTGRLKEAIEHYRQASELGFATAAERLKESQRELALLELLPAILAGQQKPRDAAEYIAFASLCTQAWQGRNAAAVQLYANGFAKDAKLAEDMQAQHRYNAACAAALAGSGKDKDVDKMTETDKAKLRDQALDWLKRDLAYWTKMATNNQAKDRALAVQKLQHWQQDADLAGVRGGGIDNLPEAERAGWHRLWAEVKAVLAKAKS